MLDNNYIYLLFIPFFFLFYLTKSKTAKKLELIFFSYFFIFFIDSLALSVLLLLTIANISLFKLFKDKTPFFKIALVTNIAIFIALKFAIIPRTAPTLGKESMVFVFVFLSSISSITWLRDNAHKFSILDYLFQSSFFPKNLFIPGYELENTAHNLSKTAKDNENKISKGIFFVSLGLFQVNILAQFLHFTYAGAEPCASMNMIQAATVLFANTFEIILNIYGYLNICRGIILILGFEEPKFMQQPLSKLNLVVFWKSAYPLLLSPITNLFRNIKLNEHHKIILALSLFTILFFRHTTLLFWIIIQVLYLLTIKISIINRLLIKHNLISWLLTFLIINISFLFFRIDNTSEISVILKGLISLGSLFSYYNEFYILWSINANFITWIIILTSLFFLVLKNSYNFKANWINLLLALFFSITSLFWFYNESLFMLYG